MGTFQPFGLGLGGHGRADSIARSWVPISSLLTYGISLTVFELFSWVQNSGHTSDPDVMTNTTLEAAVLPSGKRPNNLLKM